MTSLIDVIFLLLLFFMLSSTFSRSGEIEIATAAQGTAAAPPESEARLVFLRLGADGISVNGRPVAPEELRAAVEDQGPGPRHLVLSVTEAATAQALADALLPLQTVADARLTVLE